MSYDPLGGFASLLSNGKNVQVKDQVDGPQDGHVLSVDTVERTAIVTMTNSGFGTDMKFGPAPYGRTSNPPQVGDNCVVVFIGTGVDRPRLLSWWP